MDSGISVLFSGGSDSTLAAVKAMEKTEEVHLLTFHHKLMGKTGKHKKVILELRELYKNNLIIEYEEEIDNLYKKCYTTKMQNYLLKYRTFYFPWLCGACKLAMHISTINYNLRNNILTTFDGANIESAYLFPAQTNNYINVMKDFYKLFGMTYECPVYNINRTDNELEKMGVTITKNTKEEHLYYTNQHTCYLGLAVHAHGRLYYRPFRGKKRMERIAGEFLKIMIDNCSSYISKDLV
ncbi:7-cyano-7-deazaguanine synthase [candidate division KSB1 bacterium]